MCIRDSPCCPRILKVSVTEGSTVIFRDSTETYVKELAKNLCALDYSWVRDAFRHTFDATLEALYMTIDDKL